MDRLNEYFKETEYFLSSNQNYLKFISFSTLNSLKTCPRQYKFNYIDKLKVDKDNVYTYLGSISHHLIELLYKDEININKAIELWLGMIKDNNYYFLDYTKYENLSSYNELKNKNRKYKLSYNRNMLRYFRNFKKENYKYFFQEKRVILRLNNYFNKIPLIDYCFNGIIDFIGINDDGSVDIIDYKTSTIYTKEKYDIHSYQLILYALCIENLGYKINRVGWNFLKYARKTTRYKNGNVKYSSVERKKLKYNDEFNDCYIWIDYNEETKKKALKFLYQGILNIEKIKLNKDLDTNKFPFNYSEFYCNNLCSFYKFCDISKID